MGNTMVVSQKFKLRIMYDPIILFWGCIPKRSESIYVPMFTAALFTTAGPRQVTPYTKCGVHVKQTASEP